MLGNARDLKEVKLDRGFAPEEGHQYADLALLGIDRVDNADEVGEWTVDDLHAFRLQEADLDARRLHLHPTQDPLDLGFFQWTRVRARADKACDAGRVTNDVPRVVGWHALLGHQHLDEDIAREHFALHGAPLAV